MARYYLKVNRVGAAYLEFSRDLGKKPLYSVNKYNREWVIDVPFGSVILTPSGALQREERWHTKTTTKTAKNG